MPYLISLRYHCSINTFVENNGPLPKSLREIERDRERGDWRGITYFFNSLAWAEFIGGTCIRYTRWHTFTCTNYLSSITCACVKLLFYFLYYVNEESFIDVIFTAATHNEWHVKLQQMITPVNEIDRNPRK